jgi:acyl-homoserine-lactone acylase
VVREASDSFLTVRREFEETELGPVVHRTASHVFVVRSVNVEWPRQYEGFFELQQADSLREFRSTLARRLTVTSNYTYADVGGNILYSWQARLPRRPDEDFDYSLDVPAGDRRRAWRGIHRARDLPALLNPPGGYLQNANNPPWYPSVRDRLHPADYPAYIERGDDLSLRAQLALDALERTPRFSVDDLRRLKFDTRMLLADRTLPDLFAAADGVTNASDTLRAGLDALQAWDRTVSAGSRAAVLFERFMSIYEEQVDDPFAVTWTEEAPMTTPRGLADPMAALSALERAVADVRSQYGSELVAWGDVHRFRVGGVDLPADGAPGRYGVYRVVGFEAGAGRTRAANFGDAWVLLVHFTRPVTAWAVLAYGQTSNLDSPHSRDQIGLFANHELRPVWFSEQAIAANLERRYRPATVVDSAN